MSNIWSSAVSMILGLALSNFLYQYVREAPQWEIAFERSFFQAGAILLFVIFLSLEQ